MKIRLRAAESAAPYYDAKLSSVEMHTDEENISPFNILLANNVNNQGLIEGGLTMCNDCGNTPCKCDEIQALEDASNQEYLEYDNEDSNEEDGEDNVNS